MTTPLFEHICETICEGEKIKLIDVKCETRKLEILYPRQLIMYFAKKLKALPSDRLIGDQFGKDHATVISSYRAIQNYIDTDKVKREQIKSYADKLAGIQEITIKVKIIKELLKKLELKMSLLEQRMIALQLNVNEVRNLIDKYKP